MSIGFKLSAAFVGVALLFCLSGAVNWHFNRKVEERLVAIEHAAKEEMVDVTDLALAIKAIQLNIVQIQQWLTDISATRGLDGLNDGFDEAAAQAQEFTANIAKARQLADRLQIDAVSAALQTAEIAFPSYYAVGRQMAEAYVAGGPAVGNKFMANFDGQAAAMGAALEVLLSATDAALLDASASINALVSTATEDSNRLTEVSIGLALTGGMLCLLVLAFVQVGIVQALTRMVAAMMSIAGGDARADVPFSERRDEIGKVSKAVSIFRQNMLDILELQENLKLNEAKARKEKEEAVAEVVAAQGQREKEMSEQARVAAARATFMSETCEAYKARLSHNIQEMSGIAKTVREAVGTILQNATETRQNSETVTESADDATQNVSTVAKAADELAASSREISRIVEESVRVAKHAVDGALKAKADVNALDDAAQRIEQVVILINKIAFETNLLALNATIEAARAGEAGKGFVVVATEVKTLANQTEQATKDISSQVAHIQAVASEAVTAIASMSDTIEAIADNTRSISDAAAQQTNATSEIANSSARAANRTSEVGASSKLVGDAALETKHMATQLNESAESLVERTDGLSGTLGAFMDQVLSLDHKEGGGEGKSCRRAA